MADNTARAREQIRGHRSAIREHIEKWRRYTTEYDKNFALKTISNAQAQIQKLKDRHPSLRSDSSQEDTWSPR
jgi:ribosomal protein S20